MYNTGAVSYSTIIYPAETLAGAFPLSWFIDMAAATLTFAHLVYEELNIQVDELAVRALVKDAQGLKLRETGRLGTSVDGTMFEPQPAILIPTHEPIWTTRLTLAVDTPRIVRELGRILRTRFQMRAVI